MASSKEITKIEDILSCPICQDVIQDPRNLDCGHAFCLKCLSQWYRKQGELTGEIRCPNCMRMTPLQDRPVSALPRAYTLREVAGKVERLVRQTSVGTECQLCTDKAHIGEANVYCSTCDKAFCDRCHARHGSRFASHAILRLCDTTEKFLSCSVHAQETLKHMCTTCTSLICVLCVLDDSPNATHLNHSIIPLGEAPRYCKEQLEKEGSFMRHEMAKKKALLSEARGALEVSTTQAKDIVDFIHFLADDLISVIQEWEESAISQLENEKKECACHWEQIAHKMEQDAANIDRNIEIIHTIETHGTESLPVKAYVNTLKDVQKQRHESVDLITQISGPVIKRRSMPAIGDIRGKINAILQQQKPFIIDNNTRKIKLRPPQDYDDVVLFRKPKPIWSLSKYGSGDRELKSPVGVSFTNTNCILVCEVDNQRVGVYSYVQDVEYDDGIFIRKLAITDVIPKDAVSDEEGRIFIVDSKTNSVVIFDKMGHKITSWGNGVFVNPRCLALMSNDRVVIGDKGKQNVTVCKREGTVINAFGSKGDENDQFQYIISIETDSSDRIIVADRELNSVKLFDQNGQFLFKIQPLGDDGYCRPRYSIELAGVATDKDDNIYVTVHGTHQIIKYSAAGQPTLPCPFLSDKNGIKYPCGIAVGHNGFVAVVESASSQKHAGLRVLKI